MSRPKDLPTPSTARARGDWQGMNWIRQEKRLAIYLRDGCACVWCGSTVEQGVQLTLDHVVPVSKGGDNDEKNLVTACKRCNDSRGNRGAVEFSRVVAAYLDNGVLAKRIAQHVMSCMYRELAPYLVEAKALVARRGTAFAVLQRLGSRS
jgi:5-methylcytosine-specific restriction endonuclease McrA